MGDHGPKPGFEESQEIKKPVEVENEYVPSEGEILAIFDKLVGELDKKISQSEKAEYKEERKLEDENGVYLWEITVQREDGFAEYAYTRVRPPSNASPKFCIDVVFYDKSGFPENGQPVAKFQENGWMYILVEHPEETPVKESQEQATESVKELRECGPDIKIFEDLVAKFEADHSIEHLMSITDSKEAVVDLVWQSANKALIEVVKQKRCIEKETNISPEVFSKIHTDYKRLMNAVGAINSGKVDHNR